ncbi:MAG: hypothetical protein LUF85_01765 [Bacteroides sp.]|nr:hypothetical protein [Bacteroides sp.]
MTNDLLNSLFQKKRILSYLSQLSTVVIGILITFAGSGLIERCSRKKELNEVMYAVRNELIINKELLHTSLQFLEQEYTFYKQLDSVRHDIRQLPEDSLQKYRFAPFLSYNRVARKNAMEALKTSGLVQEIKDKDFLVKLFGIYTSYEDFQLIRAEYYHDREQNILPLIMSADKEQTEKMNTGSSWETWEYIWENNIARNYFLHAPGRLSGIIYAGKAFLDETDELLKALERY